MKIFISSVQKEFAAEAGLADPQFESMTGHFKTIIWRRGYGARGRVDGPSQGAESGEVVGEVMGEVAGEVTGEVAPSMAERIIELLAVSDLRSAEIAHAFGWQKVYGALSTRLKQMLEDKIIAYTIPSKPRSRLQKYRLTAKGKLLAARLAKKRKTAK